MLKTVALEQISDAYPLVFVSEWTWICNNLPFEIASEAMKSTDHRQAVLDQLERGEPARSGWPGIDLGVARPGPGYWPERRRGGQE